YYYIYHLGSIENVPLQDDYEYQYFSGYNYACSFTTTSTTATAITNQTEYAFQETSTWDNTFSASSELALKYKAGWKLSIADIEAGAEYGIENTLKSGFSKTWGGSKQETWKDTYTRTETFSQGKSKTVSFEFDNSSKIGYYRYILFGTVEVYAVVVIDPSDGGFYIDEITSISAYGYALDYSESSRFDDNEFGSLPFDASAILNYKKPELHIPSNGGGPDQPEPQVIYDFRNGSNTSVINITPGQTDIKISGDPDVKMPLYIVIAPRNNDLKIRLDNVYFTAPIGMAAIKDEGAAATAHTITLDVTGSNIIAGGAGYRGSDGRSGSQSTAGRNGYEAIDAGQRHSIVVTGGGSLTVTGGDGNYAIAAETAPVQTKIFPVTLIGGDGGAGGKGGKLKFSGTNGKNGSKGKNQDNDCWLDISRNPPVKTAL
ncbi:MAG: hypothetical protein LBH43_21845, partial [Treponema sp.]|nr:hypothetical protein [Treponema sp.]